MKKCNKCDKQYKLDRFYVINGRPDYYCKTCRNKTTVESHNNNKINKRCKVDPCIDPHYAKGLCKVHYYRDRYQSKTRTNFATFINRPDKAKYMYSMTLEEILKMAKSGCNICGSDYGLTVDHDHSCCSGRRSCGGCVRGVICNRCNIIVGYYEADAIRPTHSRISHVKRYLKRYEDRKVA